MSERDGQPASDSVAIPSTHVPIPSDGVTEAEAEPPDASAVAEVVLGPVGRLIAMSKSRYWDRHPSHVVAFNAGVCLADGTELWWGDLDLTLDEARLAELARRLGARVYVLIESDRAWLRGEPRRSNAICLVEADGRVEPDPRWAVRGSDGTLERPG